MNASPVQHVSQVTFGALDTDIEDGALSCPACNGVVAFVDGWAVYSSDGTPIDYVDCWHCENCGMAWNVHEV